MKTPARYRKTRSITPDPENWNSLLKKLPKSGKVRTASTFFDHAAELFLAGKLSLPK